jgi:hypothetical protein
MFSFELRLEKLFFERRNWKYLNKSFWRDLSARATCPIVDTTRSTLASNFIASKWGRVQVLHAHRSSRRLRTRRLRVRVPVLKTVSSAGWRIRLQKLSRNSCYALGTVFDLDTCRCFSSMCVNVLAIFMHKMFFISTRNSSKQNTALDVLKSSNTHTTYSSGNWIQNYLAAFKCTYKLLKTFFRIRTDELMFLRRVRCQWGHKKCEMIFH